MYNRELEPERSASDMLSERKEKRTCDFLRSYNSVYTTEEVLRKKILQTPVEDIKTCPKTGEDIKNFCGEVCVNEKRCTLYHECIGREEY